VPRAKHKAFRALIQRGVGCHSHSFTEEYRRQSNQKLSIARGAPRFLETEAVGRALTHLFSSFEKLKASDDSSAKKRLYNSLRSLQGEEMLALRKAMREEFGSEVMSGY